MRQGRKKTNKQCRVRQILFDATYMRNLKCDADELICETNRLTDVENRLTDVENRLTDMENRLVANGEGGWGGKDREFGVSCFVAV